MITSSPLFALGIKLLGLTAIAVTLISTNIALGSTQEQQEGEQQVESDGGLTATINGESFVTGDTITISGTVEEREPDSYVAIEVIDPQSTQVENGFPDVTADNTFTYSFVAGEQEEFESDEPMTESGNYRVVVRYFPPGEDADTEEVELVFEYTATSTAASPSPSESEEGAEEPRTGGTGGAAIGITPSQEGAAPPASLPPTTIFQSGVDGIRVGVPDGWVVDDRFNGTGPLFEQVVRQHGGEYLAAMCPQDQALPSAGGSHSCQLQSSSGTGVGVVFYSFANLHTRPEFAALTSENKSITTSDLLGLYFDLNRELREAGVVVFSPQIEIVTNTDIAINVFDSQTNQTIGTVPAKYVEFIEAYPDGSSYRNSVLLALSNDTNTGYVVRPSVQEGSQSSTEAPPEAPPFVRQVFDSFELVAPPTTSITRTTPAMPTVSQQEEQQPSASPSSQQLQLEQQFEQQP
jgi:hypothetical protein